MKRLLLTAITLASVSAFGQTHFTADFEAGNLTGWTAVDSDGDGENWYSEDFSGSFAELGGQTAVSRSWTNTTQGLNPDNLLISSPIDLTGAASAGLNMLFTVGTIEGAPYHAEEFSVYVTTSNDPATITSSTPVLNEVLSDPQAIGVRTVDLSSYAGQTVYVTFRHHNTFDMNTLLVDNISILNLPELDVEVAGINLPRYAEMATQNVLSVDVKNNGYATITTLELDWNDGTGHLQTVNVNIAPGATVTVDHPDAVTYATAVEKSLDITIGQINGGTDVNPADNTGAALINTVSQVVPKAVVVEEGTGTWCGWCPRGEVAMEHMYDTYGYYGQFIGIAVHNGDPMTVPAYDGNMGLTGYPGCNVDRLLLGASVSQAAFEAYFDALKDLVVPASISATPVVDGSDITINVSSTFFTPISNANYRLAVVILEDSVRGTGSGYNQVNYYSGGAQGPMGGYEALPDPVPAAQMVYNHVGRALLGGFDGQAGSVPTTITDGQVVNYTFNYTVPSNSNLSYMDAVAMLIDNNTGQIVNANKFRLDGSGLGLAQASNLKFHVYPNPAKDMITVDFDANGGDYNLDIIDVQGRTVKHMTMSNVSGVQKQTVSLEGLVAGQYFVSISNDKESTTKVIVVQ